MSHRPTLHKQENVMYLKAAWEPTELDHTVAHIVAAKVTMHLTRNVISFTK